MLLTDITLLRCLDCSSDLIHEAGEAVDGRLVNAVLACQTCGRCYPVLRGTGIFFRKDVFPLYFSTQEWAELHRLGFDSYFDPMRVAETGLELKQLQVANNWEYQWIEFENYGLKELAEDGFFGEHAFFEFIPLGKEHLRGQTVFIGCGGRGREAYHVAHSHPKRLIVNEIGREIYTVAEILGDPEAALLLRSDMASLPLKDGVVDVAICDHALQHIPDHAAAFGQLERITRSRGRVAVCVYSWENNGIMVHGVEPAKKILHLLPLKVLQVLALLPAAVLQVVIHGLYAPLGRVAPGWARKLPLHEHLLFWAKNPFRKIWASCFDLIHAPVSYHFKRDEMLALAQSRPLTVETLRHTNGTLWSMVAVKS